MSIQAIDRTSVHRLTSGQVVIDLQTAVKELVENALDAGATSVAIKFREHGVDEIEVEDNGRGIDKEDWAGLALKHHTSKLVSFDDLASVSTLGFRGEALSSLCGVAKLSMTTSTSPTLPLGTALTFTHAGECVVGGRVSRARGTTVKVERLFEQLPVRRKELVKNAKREMAKAIELVQAYALVKTGVRFEVRNIVKGKSQVHLQTPASMTRRANFSNIFAPKSLASLLDLDVAVEVQPEKSLLKRLDEVTPSTTSVRVVGLISKPSAPHGRPAGNRQFYYVNGRPFSPSKVAKAVNEVYKSFNSNQYPTVVADFQLAPDAYDVNVSPDKRTIFLHSEGNLIASLKEALARFFEPEKGTFAMQTIGPSGTLHSTSSSQQTTEDADDEPVEPPRKKRKTAEDMPSQGSRSTTGSTASRSSPPPSRASSVVVEITNPFTLDAEEEATLPEPPTAFAADSPEAGLPKGGPGEAVPDLGPTPSTSLFRQPSPTPAPEADASAASAPAEPGGSGARQPQQPPSAPSRPLAQAQLDFSAILAAAGAKSSGKTGPVGTGKPAARPAGSAAHRMQTVLQQFLKGGTQQLHPNTADGEHAEEDEEDELENTDGDRADEDDADVAEVMDVGAGVEAVPPSPAKQPEGANDHAVPRTWPSPTPVMPADDEPEDAIEEHDQPDDVIMVVEDSFRAAPPAADPIQATTARADDGAEAEVDDDELEVVAASCACVAGSQADELSVEGPRAGRSTERQAGRQAEAHNRPPATLPFGAAQSEVAGTVIAADAPLALDMARLESLWSTPPREDAAPRTADAELPEERDELVGAGIDEKDEAAEATLSRVVSKADFEAMEVVGQFNLGFIIARRRVEIGEAGSGGGRPGEVHDDLFIVDQHASDEKYNFEKLQAETVIQSQRLLAPRILNLPASDEITAMEHTDTLRLNGFEVAIDENADVGERVKLTAQPVSRETVFDIGDLEELVELIATGSGSEVVRPTKARRMFASRACRKSVMIGRALNHNQMATILQHMGGMDQPWACPHGRPTMRWLASVGTNGSNGRRLAQELEAVLEALVRQLE
ncbi:hypothetical protein JCM8202_000336 [Rhodotorula sphaerocarpa]